jgi:alkylation response protein AidB-like acyl-CoA dehydrogenase
VKFMENARSTAQRLIPGLDAALAEIPLEVLESRQSPAIGMFRDSAGPGLLVPAEFGGAQASMLDAVRTQRAIGARSPSLAVATTMHHFSLASIVALGEKSTGFEWLMMEAVARDHRLIASGFAEGNPGKPILSPTLATEKVTNGYLVSGSKKPCSLARSMDILTASIAVEDSGGQTTMAVALIPAEAPGVRIEPFWNSWVLAGAESEEVVLDRVFVHRELIVSTDVGFGKDLDELTLLGFLWFELLISAGYLGAVSALAERVFAAGRVTDSDKTRLLCEVESAALLLDGLAREYDGGRRGHDALARCLIGRYAAQDALSRAAALCVEMLGGVAFIKSPEVAYLLAASHAMALHPPNRPSMASALADYTRGGKVNVA